MVSNVISLIKKTVRGRAGIDTVLKCTMENHSCAEALKHYSPIFHSTREIIQTTAHRIFFCSVFNLVQYFSTFSLQNNFCLGLPTLALIYCASRSISGPFKGIPRASGYKKSKLHPGCEGETRPAEGPTGPHTPTWFLLLSQIPQREEMPCPKSFPSHLSENPTTTHMISYTLYYFDCL